VTLIEHLLINGLLQFGQFQRDGGTQPMLSKLDMLASYPDALRTLTDAAIARIGSSGRYDRMLCTTDALPFGVALALATNTPLVYSRGRGEVPADDLVGACDIGHPTLLIANTSGKETLQLAERSARVGLDVRAMLVLLEIAPIRLPNVECHALLQLESLIDDPVAASFIPVGQRAVVKVWLKQQNAPIG